LSEYQVNFYLRTGNKHVDQSSELSVLCNEVSDLKAMMFFMQDIIMNQDKWISDIHKSLFYNQIKSMNVLKEEKKQITK